MANIKQYTIQINGVQESINEVDALNKQLEATEARIKAIDAKKISISSTSSGGGSRTAELSDEDKLLKQIEATQARINQADMADYKVLLDKKQELKELVTEQKSMTAEARLTEGAYANTMSGMKQHLADIKAAMQTVDLGDTDTFKKLTKDANELNQKLLEIEKSYGQFGRNVGNYPSAAEGFKGLKIQVGDTVAEFVNARQALRALKQEMQTLSTKQDMGIISEEEAERLKSLIPTVKQLESSIQDAGKPMDALMDSMQSIVALAQAGKGLAAFFGLEDTGIEKSIQDLVALQNAMQGLQTIQKQMQAGDGLFKWINMGNKSIDEFTKKLFGVKKATTEVTTETKAQAAATSQVATASKAATTSEVAQTTATAGLTVGMKAATVAAKVLGFALKAIGIGVITAGLAVTIEAVKDLAKSLFSESEAAKKAREESEKLKQKIEEQRKSFIDASAQYHNAASRISHLRSEYMKTNDQLRKTSILKEASKEFKNLGISVKGVSDAETVLVKQGHDVIELLRIQGNAAAISAMRMEAYKNSFKILLEDGYDAYAASVIAGGAETVREYDEILDKLQDRTATLQEKLKIDTKVFDENKKEIANYGKELINLRLKMMKDGLNKRLMQLDEEKRQTLNKLKNNQAAYLDAEKMYNQLRLKEIEKYMEASSKILAQDRENIQKDKFNNELDVYDNYIKRLEMTVPKIRELYSSDDLKKMLLTEDYQVVLDYIKLVEKAETEGIYKLSEVDRERYYDFRENMESQYQTELDIIRTYNDMAKAELYDSFKARIDDTRDYYSETITLLVEAIEEERNLREQQLNDELKLEKNKAAERFKEQKDGFEKEIEEAQKQFDALKSIANLEHTNLTDEQREKWKELQDIILVNQEYIKQATENFNDTIINLEKKKDNELIALNLQTIEKRSQAQEKYYQQEISNYRDFNSKITQEISKQPVVYKGGFDIINIGATRKNFKEVQKALQVTLNSIAQDKKALNDDLNDGLLTPEAYSASLRQFEDLENSTKEQMEQIGENIKQSWGDWWGSIDQWIQQVGQAATSILSSLSEITSNQYEEQISQQEKYIDEYSDLLDKQKEKTQEYADAVKGIEDELSNARGDRRQQLIDNLNAEMAAQRASLAQEKKIEKEREKAEEKRKELEQDKAEAEKRMQIWQAGINAAMAVSMAAVNHWPVPAIPMMALAAAVGAAQIAAVASKPIPKYGDGGVIVGKAHKDGGVPAIVGNGYPVELEGQEYIIRKKTATQNIGLLDFVNKSEKKLRLEDFIDFYGSNSQVQKNVTSVRKRFENGGAIPSLRTDISINDRVLQAIEDYSNRPTIVSVVDIIDQTERLNNVKVISGLEV